MNKLNRKLVIVLVFILAAAIGLNSFLLYRNIARLSNTQIRVETKKLADKLADILNENIREEIVGDEFKQLIEISEYQVAVISNRGRQVIYSNLVDTKIKILLESEEAYIARSPVYDRNEKQIATLFVITKNNELQRVNTIFKAAIISSLILGIIMITIFLILLYLLVNKPLKKIMYGMEHNEPVNLSKSSDWAEVAKVHNQAFRTRLQQKKTQNEFFQNASHELKSPLMNIQGYMEGLEDKLYSSSEASSMVINESLRIKTLVDQMIRTSKAEVVEQSDICLETIDMTSFIHDLSKMIPKNIHFTYNSTENTIFQDRTILQIIMSNLIQNACRYTKDSIEITYSTQPNVFIKVRDNGPGIDPAIQEKVFQRFVKGIDGKTGLGLSMVKQYVEVTKGTIKAYNDGGAVFEITW